jgi:hypothetical protein
MVKGSLRTAVLLSALGMACSVHPAGQDLFTTSSGTQPAPTPKPTEPPLPEPCEEDTGCFEDETVYSNVTSCTNAGNELCRLVKSSCTTSSWYCGSRTAQCDGYPSCNAGDQQVSSCNSFDDCYDRTLCGTTITCKRASGNCGAVPECDAGDPEVLDTDDCKLPTFDCYSRTTCGTTIWCNNVK